MVAAMAIGKDVQKDMHKKAKKSIITLFFTTSSVSAFAMDATPCD